MQVRPRTAEDLPALVEELAAVHLADGYPVHAEHVSAQWLTPDDEVGAWVVVDGGRPVGQAVLRRVGDGLEVARLFVGTTARGTGAADLLLGTVEQQAGGEPLALVVAVRATAAIRAYERRGWRRTGTGPGGWTERDGSPAQAHRYAFARAGASQS